MAGGKDLTYRIDVNASDATASLRQFESAVKKTMKSVSDELDDTSTAGNKVAKSMDKLAAQMKEDFNSASIAAEEMQRALKAAGSGLDVSDVIPTLQRMGLSFDEITQDADKLAVSLKGLDDVRATGVEDLEARAPGLSKKLNEVEKSADSSKSALANMIGNSAQDLGELTGVTGSLGVGVGQLAEYFSDAKLAGEGLGSVMKNMASVAVPIAALGAGIQIVSSVLDQMAKSKAAEKAFHTDQVDAFTKSIRQGGDAASDYADQLADVGKVLATTGNNAGPSWLSIIPAGALGDGISRLGLFGDAVTDLTKTLDKAGISAQQWAKVVTSPQPVKAMDDLRAAVEKMNLTDDERSDILIGARQAQEDYAQGTANAGVALKVFGTSSDDAAKATEDLAKAQQDAADKVQRVTDAWNAQADALNAQVDAASAAADSQLNVNEAFARFGEVLGDAEASSKDVRDAAIALAKAQVQLASDQATATGKTITATAKLDAQNAALLNTAAAAQGPARQGILDYIGSLNQIPPEKMTDIQAAIDAGDLETAKRLLNEASAPRTAAITADAETAAAKRELDLLTADRIVKVSPVVGTTTRFDKGGRVGPGGALVAERRPELIEFPGGMTALLTAPTLVPGGSNVTGGTETARILSGASSSSTTVHVHMPRGSRPDDTVAAIRRYQRRNGGRRARP